MMAHAVLTMAHVIDRWIPVMVQGGLLLPSLVETFLRQGKRLKLLSYWIESCTPLIIGIL